MSEKLPISHEQLSASPEITLERPKAAEHGPEHQAEHVHHARQAVAAESSKHEPVTVPQLPVTDDRPYLIDKAAKTLRMKQNLAEVQNRLKPAQKRLSKAIHQPLVQHVSESAGKTVTRPSGLLGGGILAFVGSVAYLYITRHYDLAYNYSFFLLFFISGFLLGLLIEYAVYGVRRLAARASSVK
jgi:hypothetical protein